MANEIAKLLHIQQTLNDFTSLCKESSYEIQLHTTECGITILFPLRPHMIENNTVTRAL